jgi:hypothetical protein
MTHLKSIDFIDSCPIERAASCLCSNHEQLRALY